MDLAMGPSTSPVISEQEDVGKSWLNRQDQEE